MFQSEVYFSYFKICSELHHTGPYMNMLAGFNLSVSIKCRFICVGGGLDSVLWFQDWVVSKFGRVLPVLQLRCQKGRKARTVKYDPSKYCHNIRKLERSDLDETPSVTQLTWEVEGGDDDISKKRRGEFPPFEPIKPKKSRTETVDTLHAFSRRR